MLVINSGQFILPWSLFTHLTHSYKTPNLPISDCIIENKSTDVTSFLIDSVNNLYVPLVEVDDQFYFHTNAAYLYTFSLN